MKKRNLTALVAATFTVVLLGSSCGNEPADAGLDRADLSVAASADPDEGAPPLEVSFTAEPDVVDQQKDNVTYFWDFGDGTSSSEQNPSHTYAEEGSYEVTLSVGLESGDSGSARKTLTVTVRGNIEDWTDAVNDACASAATESDAVAVVNQGDVNNPGALESLTEIINAETAAIEGISYPSGFTEEVEGWLTARQAFVDAFLAAAEDGMITADEDAALRELSLELQQLSLALDLNSCAGE